MKTGQQNGMIYGGTTLLSIGTMAYGFLVANMTLSPPASSCYFVKFFGIPCAGCGGSHALQAMIHGEGMRAFLFNPLAAVFMPLIMILSGLLLVDLVFHKRMLVLSFKIVQSELRNRKFSLGLAGLLMAHWAYIVFKYFCLINHSS